MKTARKKSEVNWEHGEKQETTKFHRNGEKQLEVERIGGKNMELLPCGQVAASKRKKRTGNTVKGMVYPLIGPRTSSQDTPISARS